MDSHRRLPLIVNPLRVIALAGAAIYCFAAAFLMFYTHSDFLATHGEPYMVIAFGVITGIESVRIVRSL